MANSNRVLVLVANGFREVAVLPCVACLRHAGVETWLVGLKGASVVGAHGIAITADAPLSEAPPGSPLTLIVIPGGQRCTRALLTDPRVHNLLQETIARGGEVAVLAGAEHLVDQMVGGAAAFRHQGKKGLEAFMRDCVAAIGLQTPPCPYGSGQ